MTSIVVSSKCAICHALTEFDEDGDSIRCKHCHEGPLATVKRMLHEIANGHPPEHDIWCPEKTRSSMVNECQCYFIYSIKKALAEVETVEERIND